VTNYIAYKAEQFCTEVTSFPKRVVQF